MEQRQDLNPSCLAPGLAYSYDPKAKVNWVCCGQLVTPWGESESEPTGPSCSGRDSLSFRKEVRLGIEVDMGVPGGIGHGSFVRGGVEETPRFGGGTISKVNKVLI